MNLEIKLGKYNSGITYLKTNELRLLLKKPVTNTVDKKYKLLFAQFFSIIQLGKIKVIRISWKISA